jgi:hypothetical protein
VYDFFEFVWNLCIHKFNRKSRSNSDFLAIYTSPFIYHSLALFFIFSQTILYPTSLSKQNRCFYSFLFWIFIIIISRRIFHVRLDWFHVRKGDTILYTILRSPHRATDISPSRTRIKSACFLVSPYTYNATISPYIFSKTIFQSGESRLIFSPASQRPKASGIYRRIYRTLVANLQHWPTINLK